MGEDLRGFSFDRDGITEDVNFIKKDQIKKQIFLIRGQKVMLDSDIAGYFETDTGSLNRAMKRNIKRFPESFCFQITKEEYENLKCQIGISSCYENYGGRRTLPYVYTESGVAMLTSALHTDRAIDASIMIIEAFVEMSHYYRQNQQFFPFEEMKYLEFLENKTCQLDTRVQKIEKNMVVHSDLAELIKLFDTGCKTEEILLLNSEPFKADVAYQKIYGRAKRKIVVIDDYISSKTLQHLAHSKPNISVNVISDNKGRHPLRLSEYMDFQTEYPGRSVIFTQTAGKVHDRYIILDHGRKDVRVYHCGASSKDAGKRITTITRLQDVTGYGAMVTGLLGNPGLVLK